MPATCGGTQFWVWGSALFEASTTCWGGARGHATACFFGAGSTFWCRVFWLPVRLALRHIALRSLAVLFSASSQDLSLVQWAPLCARCHTLTHPTSCEHASQAESCSRMWTENPPSIWNCWNLTADYVLSPAVIRVRDMLESVDIRPRSHVPLSWQRRGRSRARSPCPSITNHAWRNYCSSSHVRRGPRRAR